MSQALANIAGYLIDLDGTVYVGDQPIPGAIDTINRLRDSGIPLRIADLEAELQGGVPCRSHVARALVRGGLAATTRPLYKRWLGGDRFARPALVGADAIEQVHRFAGLVFWAHPAAVHLKQVGRSLVEAGLDGVECLSKNLGPRDRAAARQFMEQHQLGVCGGSDLHFETVRARVGSYGVEESLIDPRLMGAGLLSTSQ